VENLDNLLVTVKNFAIENFIILKAYLSYPFWLFSASFQDFFLQIACYYAANNPKNPSKNNSKSIDEKIPNSYLELCMFVGKMERNNYE